VKAIAEKYVALEQHIEDSKNWVKALKPGSAKETYWILRIMIFGVALTISMKVSRAYLKWRNRQPITTPQTKTETLTKQ
jgi:hypothetical protein